MKKDYRSWTPLKRILHNADISIPFFYEREIWHSYIGENIGSEQDGRGQEFMRPIIIIRKFNKDIFWGIPLTRVRKDLPFYFIFSIATDTGIVSTKSSAILSQVRLMDAKRLARRIGNITEADFVQLKRKFKALLP